MTKDNSVYQGAMKELREAQAVMQARAPGAPAVRLPLDKVLAFKGEDGVNAAVIEVEQVIYLVDEILRNRSR